MAKAEHEYIPNYKVLQAAPRELRDTRSEVEAAASYDILTGFAPKGRVPYETFIRPFTSPFKQNPILKRRASCRSRRETNTSRARRRAESPDSGLGGPQHRLATFVRGCQTELDKQGSSKMSINLP